MICRRLSFDIFYPYGGLPFELAQVLAGLGKAFELTWFVCFRIYPCVANLMPSSSLGPDKARDNGQRQVRLVFFRRSQHSSLRSHTSPFGGWPVQAGALSFTVPAPVYALGVEGIITASARPLNPATQTWRLALARCLSARNYCKTKRPKKIPEM
jgi:hypothetical protein